MRWTHDAGIITYMTLMQGLLTDKYDTPEDIPDWYTRARHFDAARNPKTRHGEPGAEQELVKALQGIRVLALEILHVSGPPRPVNPWPFWFPTP